MSCSRTQHSDTGEARTAAPRSRVKYSTTEPLRSRISLLPHSFQINNLHVLIYTAKNSVDLDKLAYDPDLHCF